MLNPEPSGGMGNEKQFSTLSLKRKNATDDKPSWNTMGVGPFKQLPFLKSTFRQSCHFRLKLLQPFCRNMTFSTLFALLSIFNSKDVTPK
jgi:hypothetical protein